MARSPNRKPATDASSPEQDHALQYLVNKEVQEQISDLSSSVPEEGADRTTDLREKALEEAVETFEHAVCVTSNGHRCVVRPGEIIVVCRDPGFRRAGIEHPSVAIYPKRKLTEKQLTAMRKEPLLEIVEVS